MANLRIGECVVGAYVRKSSESEERQALSIEAQLTELKQFAAREQLEIVPSRRQHGRGWFSEARAALPAIIFC